MKLSFALLLAMAPFLAEGQNAPDGSAPVTGTPSPIMDITGPDGLIYPNWTWAGVQGGIPKTSVQITLADRGAAPGNDIATLLQTAIDELGAKGGGAIQLGAGTYYLDKPIFIRCPNIVLRGAGMDQTKLIFRYAIPKGEVKFYGLDSGDSFEDLYLIGNPDEEEPAGTPPADPSMSTVKTLTLFGDGKALGSMNHIKPTNPIQLANDDWGNRSYYGITREKILHALGPGPHQFQGVVEYENGTTAQATTALQVSATPVPNSIYGGDLAAISFEGGPSSAADTHILLAADGVRGSDRLVLPDGAALHQGDYIQIIAPATERWNQLSGNVDTIAWVLFRANQYQVAAVNGNEVKLNQPLRLDFPKIDGSYIQVIHPLTGCGIEDLSLEQTENLWISGIHFARSWNCWARNVKVTNTGRHPLFFLDSKFGEVRDCVFDGAQFKGGGGSAYAGFERSFDCLMDNVDVSNLRHGPILNWACSGDVIRNSVFHNVHGGHWHSGWCNENLYENCVIDAPDFRVGLTAFGPKYFKVHGPQGPHNVTYNCDIQVSRGAGNDLGIWLMGWEMDWLFAYNRFYVKYGQAMLVEDHCRDIAVHDNVFCLEHPFAAAFVSRDDTCTNINLTDNQIYGDIKAVVADGSKGYVDEGNTISPYELAPRPTPPVPSIFDWERQHVPPTP